MIRIGDNGKRYIDVKALNAMLTELGFNECHDRDWLGTRWLGKDMDVQVRAPRGQTYHTLLASVKLLYKPYHGKRGQIRAAVIVDIPVNKIRQFESIFISFLANDVPAAEAALKAKSDAVKASNECLDDWIAKFRMALGQDPDTEGYLSLLKSGSYGHDDYRITGLKLEISLFGSPTEVARKVKQLEQIGQIKI